MEATCSSETTVFRDSHNVTSQKTAFFTVADMKTSNPTQATGQTGLPVCESAARISEQPRKEPCCMFNIHRSLTAELNCAPNAYGPEGVRNDRLIGSLLKGVFTKLFQSKEVEACIRSRTASFLESTLKASTL
jgi:hypothetical protein